jgi:N-acetylglucosamine kinase-like BadF-type ATPase
MFVGIDIGGTKTRLRACRGEATVADLIVSTDSWRERKSSGDDARALAEVISRACGNVAPASLAVGAHGCDTEAQCTAYQHELSVATGSRVLVVNDSELTVPAAGYLEGIGVVAGTGSIAVARTRDGRMLTAGGWGWVLGDEGSAPALVREAARAIRGLLDRGRSDDILIDRLMRVIGTDDPTMLNRLLNATRSASAWGGYAGTVFDAAHDGSPAARRVIDEGGKALAALVALLIDRGASAARVVAGGAVIAGQPLLMDAFRGAMARVSPASDVLLLREPPVVGAVTLARRLLADAAI